MIETIALSEKNVRFLDQTQLPFTECYIETDDYHRMIEAIRKLQVRGAPAIGIAAAMTAWLSISNVENTSDYKNTFLQKLEEINASRPTAVNLFKTTTYIKKHILPDVQDLSQLAIRVREYVKQLMLYEKQSCDAIGANGARIVQKYSKFLTHCNTGGLATVGNGTALSVIRKVAAVNPNIHVLVDETRPLLQGARLTAWELTRDEIPFTLICDNMAAWMMKNQKVDCIITGADRITANGDTANKIGTLNLAILADFFGIPFYIAAPESTIDASLADGSGILIEERASSEVTSIAGFNIALGSSPVENPAFDVTSSNLITGIITEKTVYFYPYHFREQE